MSLYKKYKTSMSLEFRRGWLTKCMQYEDVRTQDMICYSQ
jgi:hypothetical protein